MMTDNNSQAMTVSISLSEDMTADVRPLSPGDAPLLEEGFANLSESSRFARFGMGMDHLSDDEVRYLTDVDQRTHVAWGATIAGEAAGVARYLVLPDGETAEIAITVVDRFQRHGLGRQLFQALVAIARHDGLKAFRFEIDPANAPVHQLMRDIAGGYPGPGSALSEVNIFYLPEDEMDPLFVELMDNFRQSA